MSSVDDLHRPIRLIRSRRNRVINFVGVYKSQVCRIRIVILKTVIENQGRTARETGANDSDGRSLANGQACKGGRRNGGDGGCGTWNNCNRSGVAENPATLILIANLDDIRSCV